jgi:hypothetical protein
MLKEFFANDASLPYRVGERDPGLATDSPFTVSASST